MRAEFFRKRIPDKVIGVAEWDGREVAVQAKNAPVRQVLDRIFRPSPVVVEDPAMRPAGSHGPAILAPGGLGWFMAAARVRGQQEGLGVRFVTDRAGGWDPAGSYEPMNAWVSRQQGPRARVTSLGTSRA